MRNLALASSILPALLVAAGCAADKPPADGERPAALQREYRTGTRFPSREPAAALTDQERQQQIDDAQAAAQRSSTGYGSPSAAGR